MVTSDESYDLIIVGGGINGAGIALDASGRGLKVLLCEKNDLACAASSNSSKLIHGGLRYLQYFQFKLVREALNEREVLLKNSPHIMRPLRFRLPHRPYLRPMWMIRAALFLYDHLAKRLTLAPCKRLKFGHDSPLITDITYGFEYSDVWVDDARLVVINAFAARKKGADIRTYTKCIKALRGDSLWSVTLQNQLTGAQQQLTAKVLVNAAGPWVTSLFSDALNIKAPNRIRLVKGSHIVVPKIHDQPEAYILQNIDGRIVFVIPYQDEFSLIGTTEVEYHGDPAEATISEEEITYLLNVTNDHFKHKINQADIVTSYSGVRPLIEDDSQNAQSISRGYRLELDDADGCPPLLSVFGGKITTYRTLSQSCVDKLSKFFPAATGQWTADCCLPGGDISDRVCFEKQLTSAYPWLKNSIVKRYVRCYGSLTSRLLENISALEAMGVNFGAGLYEVEVNYLIAHEWAHSVNDIIWRRTKLGLYLNDDQIDALTQFIDCHPLIKARKMAA